MFKVIIQFIFFKTLVTRISAWKQGREKSTLKMFPLPLKSINIHPLKDITSLLFYLLYCNMQIIPESIILLVNTYYVLWWSWQNFLYTSLLCSAKKDYIRVVLPSVLFDFSSVVDVVSSCFTDADKLRNGFQDSVKRSCNGGNAGCCSERNPSLCHLTGFPQIVVT